MKTKNLFLLPTLIAGLGLMPVGPVTAQTFTTLHSFTARTDGTHRTNSDGALPYAGLILSGTTLYGTATEGGSFGGGTVFAVSTEGTGFTSLHSFTGSDGGVLVAGLVQSYKPNRLYGTAGAGGNGQSGTVFALNADGTGFTNLHSFATISSPSPLNSYGTNSDGFWPYGTLILSSNALCGTTFGGSSSGNGTVFAVNTDGSGFTNLHSFTLGTGGANPVNGDGAHPYGGLVLSGNTLYGTATQGGSSGYGTVFKVNTDGSGFTTLHSFIYVSDGAYPQAGLILSGNTLYGTAFVGGTSGYGTVFAVHTDGTGFTNLHSFAASTTNSSGVYTNIDGANPEARLLLSGTTLYGTALYGGSAGIGTVFAVNTDGTGFTILHAFTGGRGNQTIANHTNREGAFPNGPLVLSGNTLYGTAAGGGSSGNGTVFKLLVNRAPLSVANVGPVFAISSAEPNRFILSPNNADATLVLDGSQSSDADNDLLQFSWSVDGQPNVLATGAVATHLFAVGPHTVRLVVSDGHDTATAQVSFEVITPATAVGQLMIFADEANFIRRNKQPLLATLSAAMSSFDRGDMPAALNQLSAFQNKVGVQLVPWNPALASEFTAAAQQIITVASGR